MILYVIAFLYLIGGINTTGNDQCIVPIVCPKEGRTGFISVPSKGKLSSSLSGPNKCSMPDACKQKLDEAKQVFDNELNKLKKEYEEMNELLKKKVKAQQNTTSTGDITTAEPTEQTHPSSGVTTTSPAGEPSTPSPETVMTTYNPSATTDSTTSTHDSSTTPPDPSTTPTADVTTTPQVTSKSITTDTIPTSTADVTTTSQVTSKSITTDTIPTSTADVTTSPQVTPMATSKISAADTTTTPSDPCIGVTGCIHTSYTSTIFSWTSKCFCLITGIPFVNYTTATTLCPNSSNPGNLYSEEHREIVMQHHRLPVWLGMTYNETTNKTSLYNGTEISYALQWVNTFPRESSTIGMRTQLSLYNSPNSSVGIANADPVNKFPGILCEFP